MRGRWREWLLTENGIGTRSERDAHATGKTCCSSEVSRPYEGNAEFGMANNGTSRNGTGRTWRSCKQMLERGKAEGVGVISAFSDHQQKRQLATRQIALCSPNHLYLLGFIPRVFLPYPLFVACTRDHPRTYVESRFHSDETIDAGTLLATDKIGVIASQLDLQTCTQLALSKNRNSGGCP